MRVTLFAHQSYSEMGREDRVRACYQHACLRYVCRESMTNASLRERLGINDQNYPIASRIIGDTIEAGLIRLQDPETRSNRTRRYVPYWAEVCNPYVLIVLTLIRINPFCESFSEYANFS